MYGLITGGPVIDVERCDQILERGCAKGIVPSKPATDLAVELVIAYNAEQKDA